MTAKCPRPPLDVVVSDPIADAQFDCFDSQSNDCNLLAWTSSQADQRRVYGQSCTHHWCGNGTVDVVGNLEGEVLVRTDVRSIATLRDSAIGVRGSVSVYRIGAVILLISLAVIAGQVCLDLSADTDSV
jgi:hypothetical protein